MPQTIQQGNMYLLRDISRKLDAILSIQLRILLNDREFKASRKKGTGELANYLAGFGLSPAEIAMILSSPVKSIRTLLTPGRRKK